MPAVSFAENLIIGIGLSKPPYIIQSENRGLEYEIVEKALAHTGYNLAPRYFPLARLPHALDHGDIDGAFNMREGLLERAHLSDVVVTYQNHAITLSREDLDIDSIGDLGNHSVVAFHNAHKLLGADYRRMSEANEYYYEVPDQARQARMLVAGRVQAVVSDRLIFEYFYNELASRTAGPMPNLTFHPVFPPTAYRMGFASARVRNNFNIGLKALRESGEYDQIVERYTREFRKYVRN